MRLHWLDGSLSQLFQWRYLKQAQIRACSGGPHRWSFNGAVLQFYRQKSVKKKDLHSGSSVISRRSYSELAKCSKVTQKKIYDFSESFNFGNGCLI